MPFSDQVYAEPLGETWRAYLRTFLDGLESAASALAARVTTAEQKLLTLTPKPAGGYELADLSTAAKNGLVQTDGTVLRAVKLTQAQYDALGTKVATTLYVIV